MITLEENEQIVFQVHKHWITLLAQAILLTILLPLPYIAYFYLPLPQMITVPGNHLYLFFFFGLLWALLLWVYFFIFWTMQHLDGWIVTNKRIIDVEQFSLFHRNITSFRLDRIQDVSVETAGVLATFFGFGTIHVQTAGEENDLLLTLAHSPDKAKEVIFRLSNQAIDKTPTTGL